MSKIQRSVIPAHPGWFVVMVDEEMRATVQPVGAWQVVIDATDSFDDPTVTVEPMIPGGRYGAGVLSAVADSVIGYEVFSPSQNPLPWAESVEEWAGERIAVWDVSNWRPSKSPLFSVDDEAADEEGWG